MNKEKIISLLCEVTEKNADQISSLPENTPLSELGLDSIRFIRFVVAVEEEFNIEINDSDLLLSNFETLEKLFQTLRKYFNDTKAVKKVLVCDCDNVLWHGISGEEDISIDDKVVLFQNELIRLYHSGILLCLCSKNEKGNIEEAFRQLDMPLYMEHMICSRIDMNDKASNIKAISEELSLPVDSFVYVDDSDYEIGLVKSLLPDVETVKANYDDMSFIGKISGFFDLQGQQDLNRTQLYKEQKEREKAKLQCSSVEEYNNSLETKLLCATTVPGQAERIAELSRRTNQFNLSGRRYTKDEIESYISRGDYMVLSLSVTDRYGEMGIVGAAVIHIFEQYSVIESFFLSCRAFGRGFENTLLDEIKKQHEGKKLSGVYVPTEKNGRYSRFYAQNGVNDYESVR